MNFGSEYADLCLSYFSTPFRAYAVIMTAAAYDGEVVTPVYDYTSHYSPSGSTVISSIKTLTTGLAVADPVIVAWQIDDVETFPSEYVKSLVARYTDVPAPASTSTPTVNALKPTTQPAAVSDGLSTGTQIGIGVGVALAAALIGGLLIFWCLRRRKALATEEQDAVMPEMEDQDHTHSERKWYFGGRWRSEVDAHATQNELDSKAVHVVPGPPAELEAHEPAVEETSITGHNNDRPLERV
jgi:hypothetical protein